MLKFIFIFFLLSIKIFTQSNIDPKIAYFRENFYSSSQIIKNTKVTKIINKEGVDYFLDLNLKLLNSIKNNDFKNIKELINKGVDVRTGIYYAARENKIDILKELFKFDKIDFNNEIYFIPKDFFIDDRKWIENIKIYKNNFFIVYENYNQNLKSVLENVNLMDISTIKLLLENSFNSSYVNHELMFRLFNIISQTEDIEKIKLLINFFEINLFDQYLNISLFKEIIKNSKNDIIKYFMKNLTSEDYKKLNNLYTPMDIIFEYSLNLNGKKNFRLNLKEIF